jgi:hypothetical protein
MYRLTINREYLAERTTGSMSYNGKKICNCVELPIDDNPTALSCIPEGEYPVLIRKTEELGLHLWIADVPVRGHILINSVENARKMFCRSITPVMKFAEKGHGLKSPAAMEKLLEALLPDLEESKPVKLFITSKHTANETKTLSEFNSDPCPVYARQRA